MRRTKPALHLANSPLLLALAQVRISPVLQMSTFVPDIQERLRKRGYPKFSVSQTQEIVLDSPGGPHSTLGSKWIFGDRSLRTVVIVAPNFVALETSDYNTFDAFADRMLEALAVVGEVASIELAERLGLRYLDFVGPREGESIADYLSPGLLGIGPMDGLRGILSRYVAQGVSDVGRLVVRVSRGSGQLEIPPDLQPLDVEIPGSKESHDWALLDFDHFSMGSREYKPDQLVDGLWELHDLIDSAFRSSATPQAFEIWGSDK